VSYGKGCETGRKEAHQEWASLGEEFGLGATLDEVRAALESRQKPPEGEEPASIENDERFKELHRENHKLAKSVKEYEAQLKSAQARADQARLDKFARVAMAKGVGEKQLDYFLTRHSDRVQMTEDGNLVVLTPKDGHMIDGIETVDGYIDGIIKDAPFLLAPKGGNGAGSLVEPTAEKSKPRSGTTAPAYDPRPASERLKDRRG
jgi:hypothetical protein